MSYTAGTLCDIGAKIGWKKVYKNIQEKMKII
jgi:hypothetical protein